MNRSGNRHPIEELYQSIADGETPRHNSRFEEYGITEAMRIRVRMDTKKIHAIRDTGNRKGAWDEARNLAQSLISEYRDSYVAPKPEDPRALADQILRHGRF